MGISLEHDETRSLIRLEGALDIACAAELKKLLLKVLEPCREVRVCFTRITSLDAAVIELLWTAQRAARCSDVPFVLAGQVPARVSAALVDAGRGNSQDWTLQSLLPPLRTEKTPENPLTARSEPYF